VVATVETSSDVPDKPTPSSTLKSNPAASLPSH
jgi:hypothetical protein